MDNTIIIAIISSGALSTLITGLFTAWKSNKEREDGVTAGVRMLLYDRVKFLGKKYLEKGMVTAEELEDLVEMHRIYHNMGGNGFLDSIMDSVKHMQIIP